MFLLLTTLSTQLCHKCMYYFRKGNVHFYNFNPIKINIHIILIFSTVDFLENFTVPSIHTFIQFLMTLILKEYSIKKIVNGTYISKINVKTISFPFV